MARVVVGIDGSPGADVALRFALAEARLRDAELRVVCAWEIPAMALAGGYVAEELPGELERTARQTITDALERAGADRGAVGIETLAVEGQAAQALLEAADGADLLVVGTRGRGGFASLLLGSVSQAVAHHAQVPVAIIPSGAAADA